MSWALASDLPEVPGNIGTAKLRLALVAMANHANADGIAFPSQQTLATEISGFARRDIQNALSVLEGGGHLIRVGKQGRSVKYRMACVDVETKPKRTGYPVNKAPRQLTGELTGNMTGELTGNLTGYPVPNRTEVNSTPPTPTPTAPTGGTPWAEGTGRWGEEYPAITQTLSAALASHGIPTDHMADVWDTAQADPNSTHPQSRLIKSPAYALQCLEQVKAKRSAAHQRGPKCEEHPEFPAANCPSCMGDVKCGERPYAYVGRILPTDWKDAS